jgi:predicted GNAT family acetyltransferase
MFKTMMRSSKKLNEVVFGPLQLKGEFSYEISNKCEINDELLKYINYIDEESGLKTKIIDLIESAVFIRVVRIDLGYIKPIVGLLTITGFNNSYNISHISVSDTFRKQGIAKLMLTCFANNLDENCIYTMICCIIPHNLENLIDFFRSFKFNELTLEHNNHMLKTTKCFINLTNSPINVF